MASFYPRKQTVIIFAVCMAVVFGAAYYSSAANQTNAATQQGISGQAGSQNIGVSADDASGTAPIAASSDWKAQFLGTSSLSEGSYGSNGAASQPSTLTNQFGRDVFTQYMQLEQAGLATDPDSVDQTVNSIVDTELNSQQPRAYTLADMNIVPADDSASLSRWAAVVVADLNLYTAQQSEATIVQNYLSQNDASILKGIDPIVASYKKMVASLIAVPTPSSISSDSLDLLNSLSELEFAAESFRSLDSDSMKGMLGLSAYSDGVQKLLAALKETQDALQAKGVPFNFNSTILTTLLDIQQS